MCPMLERRWSSRACCWVRCVGARSATTSGGSSRCNTSPCSPHIWAFCAPSRPTSSGSVFCVSWSGLASPAAHRRISPPFPLHFSFLPLLSPAATTHMKFSLLAYSFAHNFSNISPLVSTSKRQSLYPAIKTAQSLLTVSISGLRKIR